MMRRGLWQQKQRHPSACLLCRFSYSYGPYTRTALRPSSSPDGNVLHPDGASRTPSSAPGHSTRSYSAAAGRDRLGGFGTSNPRNPTGLGGLARLGTGRIQQRAASTKGLPSWATQPVQPPAQPATGNDGLLPHERAAREKAMARPQPPPPLPFEEPKQAAKLAGLLPHERAAREKVMARAQPPPSLPFEELKPAAKSAGLLPDERAAREKAVARAQPPPPLPFEDPKQTAKLEGMLPHERAAWEKAITRPRPPPAKPMDDVQPASFGEPASQPTPQPKSAPAPKKREPAGPSWLNPVGQPAAAAAASDSAQQPRRDPLAFLLPHERAARDRAAARNQAQAQPAQPQSTSPSPLLPHERAARERATARTASIPPRPTAESDSSGIPDTMSRDYVSLQHRRRRAFGLTGSSWDNQIQNQRRQPDAFGTTTQEPRARAFEQLGSAEDSPRRPSTLPFELPRPSSSTLTRTLADQADWKNLTRRERKPPPGFGGLSDSLPEFDFSASAFGKAPQARSPNTGKDPWSVLGQGPAGRGAQTGSSNGGLDQWELIEKAAAQKPSKTEKAQVAAADANTWSWADDYAEEAKQVKTQRIAREMQQQAQPETTPVLAETPFAGIPPRRSERDDRNGRADRHGRGDRGDRVEWSEKPKKPQFRRRVIEEDDDWDDDFYEEKRRRKAEKAEKERQRLAALGESGLIPIFLPEYISVTNLAIALRQKVDIFVHQLEELGFEDVGKDNILTGETAALVAQEYGFEPTVDAGEDEDLKPSPIPADPSSLPLRPPVVTIMGHVDHGKTTLLDYLRKSSIVSQEHGGITQHIGAFSVSLSGGTQITFLDTPGHAAFLSMRQRGANVTDMVILVVAADDSVKPQTLEALKHARSAKVPIIVAINKVDKPEANVDRVKADLAKHGVEIEDYGGDVQVVCVSGKTGQGMADLEENVLLLSEMLDIRSDKGGMAEGWVLESTIKPIGRVATILVKRGTLRPGDFVVAGRVHAKIRSLHNEAGVEVDEATPGTAVEVLGWKEPPVAGDQVLQAPDEGRAKAAVRYRQELKDRGEVIGQMAQQEQDRRERELEREREKAAEAAANPRNRRLQKYYGNLVVDEAAEDETPAETTQYLTYLVKGDVHGSVEAVTAALLEQGNNEIRAKILVSAPGKITESDIEHAAVSGSTIINFNNTVPGNMKRLANEAGVKIMDHNVIYHLVEEVRDRLADALPPLVSKKVVGEAEVLQVFPINVKGRRFKNIAGCKIGNGSVKKGCRARVIRGGEEIYEGNIETLKNVKKDVEEMKKGSECGLSFAEWDELQAGDHIQAIEEISEKRTL